MGKKSKPIPAPLLAPESRRPADAKSIVVQVKADGWREIRRLALDLDTSVQRLGVEAWNDLMAKHGRKVKIESAWD
jgi:hypothetical protein